MSLRVWSWWVPVPVPSPSLRWRRARICTRRRCRRCDTKPGDTKSGGWKSGTASKPKAVKVGGNGEGSSSHVAAGGAGGRHAGTEQLSRLWTSTRRRRAATFLGVRSARRPTIRGVAECRVTPARTPGAVRRVGARASTRTARRTQALGDRKYACGAVNSPAQRRRQEVIAMSCRNRNGGNRVRNSATAAVISAGTAIGARA
jgi:hypothetical protein